MIENLIHLEKAADKDILCDLFCGFGGSGGGLLSACDTLNRTVKGHFVNHSETAIAIHKANHPEHEHYKEDLFLLDPASIFAPDTYCSLLWASVICTFFSIARGAACVNEQDRSHASILPTWVRRLKPDGIIVENVREFLTYGPLMQKRDGAGALVWTLKGKVATLPSTLAKRPREIDKVWRGRVLEAGYIPFEVPDPSRKGVYFDAWVAEMEALGYTSDWRLLRSADYGDPTIRQRLFVYFVRKDCGKRIVWPSPTHAKEPTGCLKPWRTARDIIDWSLKGTSVFSRKKALAANTFRRLAIGLVKYGLRDFLLPSNKGWVDGNVRSTDQPLATLTAHARAEGLVQPVSYVIPKDQGWDKQSTRSIDEPVSVFTTEHRGEGLVQPCIVQMKGQSTAQDIDSPLTALTGRQSHYVMEPLIDNLRGTGVAQPVSEPLRTVTAGGNHAALVDAFMMAIDQTGGGRNHGTYPVDEPVRTLVTKANTSCIEFELSVLKEGFKQACVKRGIDSSRAETFLGYLVGELKKAGKEVKPWIYVYYSNGSEGADIDTPLPTVRTKAGTAICYPVIEIDGTLLRIDLFYRMLTPMELQRAMGFPDSMSWAGCTNEQIIRAIGNSVSHGVARALGLAWYSQQENIAKFL